MLLPGQRVQGEKDAAADPDADVNERTEIFRYQQEEEKKERKKRRRAEIDCDSQPISRRISSLAYLGLARPTIGRSHLTHSKWGNLFIHLSFFHHRQKCFSYDEDHVCYPRLFPGTVAVVAAVVAAAAAHARPPSSAAIPPSPPTSSHSSPVVNPPGIRSTNRFPQTLM